MKRLLVLIAIALGGALLPPHSEAQQSEQIRIEQVCTVVGKRLRDQLANPLYSKALERKKNGNQLPMSRARLEYVTQLRAILKAAKCKNSP